MCSLAVRPHSVWRPRVVENSYYEIPAQNSFIPFQGDILWKICSAIVSEHNNVSPLELSFFKKIREIML